MFEHRTVDLFEDIAANLDDEVGADAEDETVERCMVKLAQGEPVRNYRLAPRMAVGQNMCGFEQFAVAEPADRTGVAVRAQDPLAKRFLMQAPHSQSGDVAAAGFGDLCPRNVGFGSREAPVVDGDLETEIAGIVADYEDGPARQLLSPSHTRQIDKRHAPEQCQPQASVVTVVGIGPSVPVVQQAGFGVETVIIGRRLSSARRCGGNAEGDFGKDSGLEDPLRANQRDPLAAEGEAKREDLPGQHVALNRCPRREEVEGSETDRPVEVVPWHRRARNIANGFGVNPTVNRCPQCAREPRKALDARAVASAGRVTFEHHRQAHGGAWVPSNAE